MVGWEKVKEISSNSHIYVLVNIKKDGKEIEYYVVLSKIVAQNPGLSDENWENFYFSDAKEAEYYRDRWKLFGDSGAKSV